MTANFPQQQFEIRESGDILSNYIMWSDFSQAFLLKTWKNINTPRFVQNSRHYLTTFNEKSLENSSSTKIKSMLITRIYAGDTWDVDMINCGKCVE